MEEFAASVADAGQPAVDQRAQSGARHRGALLQSVGESSAVRQWPAPLALGLRAPGTAGLVPAGVLMPELRPGRPRRDGFDIERDGRLRVYIRGPADAALARDGRWTATSAGIEVAYDDGGPVVALEIVDGAPGILKVRGAWLLNECGTD